MICRVGFWLKGSLIHNAPTITQSLKVKYVNTLDITRNFIFATFIRTRLLQTVSGHLLTMCTNPIIQGLGRVKHDQGVWHIHKNAYDQ